jgi:hypothetical protein
MGGNESEACQCAKHDRKAENVLSRPTNERVAATAAGRFVDAPSDTPPISSYDFRVAPIRENPEMLLSRPENPEFEFAPGRYALVVKGQAYDFTVAGEITETAQCLERTEAANGTFYSECRTLD